MEDPRRPGGLPHLGASLPERVCAVRDYLMRLTRRFSPSLGPFPQLQLAKKRVFRPVEVSRTYRDQCCWTGRGGFAEPSAFMGANAVAVLDLRPKKAGRGGSIPSLVSDSKALKPFSKASIWLHRFQIMHAWAYLSTEKGCANRFLIGPQGIDSMGVFASYSAIIVFS